MAAYGRCSRLVAALALAAATHHPLPGQSGAVTEGGAFLLIPIGARALGMGQAVVADQPGTEAVWWNPAGAARAEKREAAVHHYETFAGNGNALSILFPSSRLGVLVASLYILDYGESGLSDPVGNPLGTVGARNLVYAATYSTAIGSRVSAGITFKVVQFRVDCSGACEAIPNTSASTSAIDIGAQYEFRSSFPITLAVALRHFGLSLQVNDKDQADPLPTRLDFGARYRVTQIARYSRDVELQLAADLVDEPDFASPMGRMGADLSWRRRVHLRGGYVFDNSESSGPSVGIGLSTGNFFLDFARVFEGFSESAGQPPVYISLRVLF